MKYEELARKTLEGVGGIDNISHVTHCATRLRIQYKDKDLVDESKMQNMTGTAGLVHHPGQIQVIIGPDVNTAYNDFLSISGWDPEVSQQKNMSTRKNTEEEHGKRGITYWMNKFGNFVAPIFMPIVPALIVGGLILAVRNFLVNYFGVSADGGTATIMLAIFDAGFTFLPIYVGYTYSAQLKMQPIMGALLGGVLVCSKINGVEGLDFLGISIPTVSYGSTILPIILGISLMYWVDKLFKKIIPEMLVFVLKPLLTMIIVVPITLVVLGPLGTNLSGYVATFILWLTDTFGFISQPIMAVIYPYMVMLGVDKALIPLGVESIATQGFNTITGVMGFVSNICIGTTALALSTSVKNREQKGLVRSFAVTGLCGVSEPALYGALISRPLVLVGTAIGAASAGLVAGILGLRSFVQGGCPGLLTFLFYVDQDGGLHYLYVAILVAAVAIAVTFISTKVILKKYPHLADTPTKQNSVSSQEEISGTEVVS